jgi:hypothetical protein
MKKCNLVIPRHPIKDIQATAEVFTPQTSKHEISKFFLFFFFFLPSWIRILADPHYQCGGYGSGCSRPKSVRIRADLDPKHCLFHLSSNLAVWYTGT